MKQHEPQHPHNNLMQKHIKQITWAAELAINGGCITPLECVGGTIDKES